MKSVCLFFFLIITFVLHSQVYQMNSDIWLYDTSTKTFKPKNAESFGFLSKEVIQKIDTSKINSYLIESMNEFRKFYGSNEVKEDIELTKICKSYSKKLSQKLVHDPQIPSNQSEVITKINFILLSKIDTNLYDINKVIADCCFDIFVASESHMKLLLDNTMTHYGFGIYQDKTTFNICIRGTKK